MGKNDITMDTMRTRGPSEAYDAGYDRIFGKKAKLVCGSCGGSGWVPRDPDIGTDQECFVCDGTGSYADLPYGQ
jgi:DnaJ-class molecular chaperone